MDIRTQSALLAAIIGIALGVSMLLRPGRARVITLYSVFSLVVGGFYLAHFFSSLLASSDLFWLPRISLGAELVFGATIPSLAMAFFLEFLGGRARAFRTAMRFGYLTFALGLAVGLTPLARQSWARIGLTLWVFAALSLSLTLVIRRMRQSDSRIERARLMYLAIGAAVAILLAGLDFLPRFGIPFLTLGPVACTFYLFFLAQTLLRLRLMDLHELLGKVAAQTVLAIILAAVFCALTGWVHSASLFIFNTAVAAFVMLILLEPLRAEVDQQVVRIFFRERFELLEVLSTLRTRMATVIDVSEVAALVLDTLFESRRVTHASLFLLAEDRPGFRLLDHRGPVPAYFLDAPSTRGLMTAAAGGHKAVLLEHLDRRIAEVRAQAGEGKRIRDEIRRINETRATLQQMKAGISVPLLGNDRVIGFLNLMDERVPEAFASDEIALVLDIAERLATVLENSKLYDRMRERDRLAALGEMAAGLAHEIRNPLGAIKGAAQCLDPRQYVGEDGEFLEVIIEEVNRLNGVVTQFLDYARPMKQTFGPTDLNEVVTRTLKLVVNEIPKEIELKMELAESLPKVSADAEQLKQVLINLVQNAVQALKPVGGKISMRTFSPERFSDFRGPDWVQLEVVDDGPGIPSDQQEHIFVPFYTTKQKGTGLGLAICQRIVKNHGGSISVQSKANEGTSFVIRLPPLPAEASPEVPADGTPLPGTLVKPAPVEPPLSTPGTSRRDRRRRRA